MVHWGQPLPLREHKEGVTRTVTASLSVIVARVGAMTLGYLAIMLAARWYGKEATGFQALINSSGLLFSCIAVFGLGPLAMRDLALSEKVSNKAEKSQLFRCCLHIVTMLSLMLALPTIFFLAQNFTGFAATWMHISVVIAFTALFGRSLMQLGVSAARSVGSTHVYGVFIILPALINLCVLAVFKFMGQVSPMVPAAAIGAGALMTGLIAVVFVLRQLHQKGGGIPPKRPSIYSYRSLLVLGGPFAISMTCAMLITEGNMIVVGFILPMDKLGEYAVAHKIATLSAFFVSSFGMIASPNLARIYADGKTKDLVDYCRRTNWYILIFSIPILLFFLIFGEQFIVIAFGEEFRTSAPILTILLIGQSISALTGLTDPYLTMTGGQVILSRIILISAVLSFVLAVFLTPMFGTLGPAIAMSVSIVVWKTSTWIAIRFRDGIWLGVS